MLTRVKRANMFPMPRTTRRIRAVGDWYEATPTKVSRRRMRRVDGMASARRMGGKRARRGENQRTQTISKPLISRAHSGKNQIMGRSASNTLHHRKPAESQRE